MSTLARLVARVRDAANQRLWEQLYQLLTVEQRQTLERLPLAPGGAELGSGAAAPRPGAQIGAGDDSGAGPGGRAVRARRDGVESVGVPDAGRGGPLVFPRDLPSGVVHKAAYVFCVLEQFHRHLRRRDIYAPESSRWGDPRAKLLSGPAWQQAKPQALTTLSRRRTRLSAPAGLPAPQ